MKKIFSLVMFLTLILGAQASHAMGAKIYGGYAGEIKNAKGKIVGSFHKVTGRVDLNVVEYNDHFGFSKMSLQMDAANYSDDLIAACQKAGLNERLAELNVLVLRGVRGHDYVKNEDVYDVFEHYTNCYEVLH